MGLNKAFKGFHIRISLLICVVMLGLSGIKKKELCAPKGVIDDAVVVKIQSDDAEVEPRPAGPSQPQPGTVSQPVSA